MKLEPVIGLEIHVQLKTKSKMFCSCDNPAKRGDNGGEDKPINSCVCEICMGHPGTLPVTNRQAIEWSLKAAIALNCKIANESKFDRKHYFYPDLPKGYQISQYDQPFGKGGFLKINNQKIRINRLHLEEDAAKLLHPSGKNYSIVDYNRAGIPLMEIVTEPDISDPKVAGNFLRELRAIMRVLGVSNADMEKGNLRCDANISLREITNKTRINNELNTNTLNPKTEIKNLNSFRAVERALAYEIKRQRLLWEQGNPPRIQSTRGWDEAKAITVEQREKEEAHDYRYFPEPDIPPILLKHKTSNIKQKCIIDISAVKNSLPELPQAKRQRFVDQYGFSWADAQILTRDYNLSDYVEKVMSELLAWVESLEQENVVENSRLAKLAANWLINELAPRINHKSRQDRDKWKKMAMTAENFAEFVALIAEGKISAKAGQQILGVMLKTGQDPSDIIAQKNLVQVGDKDKLIDIVKKVIADNPEPAAEYKSGKKIVIKFLMGAVMRETNGRANPQVVERLLIEILNTK
jgi:aspartyl-tRNA(Asn)/glutamyl-tRNA(Gln) amidotransferase subunit B